jgi:hypothetical protein
MDTPLEKRILDIEARLLALDTCMLEVTRVVRHATDLSLHLAASENVKAQASLAAIHDGNRRILDTLLAAYEAARGK